MCLGGGEPPCGDGEGPRLGRIGPDILDPIGIIPYGEGIPGIAFLGTHPTVPPGPVFGACPGLALTCDSN